MAHADTRWPLLRWLVVNTLITYYTDIHGYTILHNLLYCFRTLSVPGSVCVCASSARVCVCVNGERDNKSVAGCTVHTLTRFCSFSRCFFFGFSSGASRAAAVRARILLEMQFLPHLHGPNATAPMRRRTQKRTPRTEKKKQRDNYNNAESR